MQKIEDDIKIEKEMMNYKAWLQGFYNYNAIASAFSENAKYFDKPIEFSKQPRTKEEENKLIAEKIKASAMRTEMLLKQRSEK